MAILQAIAAALLFGLSAPLAKILLTNIAPIPLAAFLYLGSGIGLGVFQSIQFHSKSEKQEASLSLKELPWLVGSIGFGGILAPIILMISLKYTYASTASLLLNFEGVATSLIALYFFKENLGKRMVSALLVITLASIILSWNGNNQWGFSLGALGILGACICWGIDNNFTRNISMKNPFTIVIIKGFTAGIFSLCLALGLHQFIPTFWPIILAMVLGFFSYGLSIVLFVLAMRTLGSSRTSAYFATAPFIGTLISFFLFHNLPTRLFYLALPMMIIGTVIILKENHCHEHEHCPIEHDHRHSHTDGHHEHTYENEEEFFHGPHSHLHSHRALKHSHTHTPDIHHRHTHGARKEE